MDLAAATAAPRVLTLGDKQYTFSRLTLRDWGELEAAALESYRRDYLRTRIANADLLSDGDQAAYKARVLQEALALTKDDLPKKTARIMAMDEAGKPLRDEQGELRFVTRLVEYQIWWFHECVDGRLHAIWLSLRKHHPDLTLEQLDAAIIDEFLKAGVSADNLADLVGEISGPSVGNSQAPQTAAPIMTPEQLGQALSERHARRTRRRQRRSRDSR